MAIYHSTTKIISRKKGQSAVASASYRSGEKLVDEQSGETKFYKRDVQPEAMILAPSNSPEWVYDRERLWNEVESVEKRKDSQLAREVEIALPVELTNEQQTEFVKSYVQDNFVDEGMIADFAIHRDNSSNPHAHIMLTMREISEDGFGKKNRDWNDRSLIQEWRKDLSDRINQELEKIGSQERVSHLSHEERGLEVLPTVHLGHVAHDMEKRGVETELGSINRERQEYNQVVIDLQKYREEKQKLERRQKNEQQSYTPVERTYIQSATKYLGEKFDLPKVEKRLQQLDHWDKKIANDFKRVYKTSENYKKAGQLFDDKNKVLQKIKTNESTLQNINWKNVFKLKENNQTKALLEGENQRLKPIVEEYDRKLDEFRDQLGFSNESDFRTKQQQEGKQRPNLLAKIERDQKALNQEREVLRKAEETIKGSVIQKVASMYTNNPEIAHVSFETAKELQKLNTSLKRIVPIDEIKDITNKGQESLRKFAETTRTIQNKKRVLDHVGSEFEKFDKANRIIKRFENNPLLRESLKRNLLSEDQRNEYNQALADRKQYAESIKEKGVKSRADFLEQKEHVTNLLSKDVPEEQERLEKGHSLFAGIFQGITEALQSLEQQQRKDSPKIKVKQKTLDIGGLGG